MGNAIVAASNMNNLTDISGNTLQNNAIIEKPREIVEENTSETMIAVVDLKEPDNNLMEKLENEGMDKVTELSKIGKQFDIDSLMNIMKEGSEEFKKKEGRNMTYAEMRRLYG